MTRLERARRASRCARAHERTDIIFVVAHVARHSSKVVSRARKTRDDATNRIARLSTLIDVRSMMRATTTQTTRATHHWTSTRRAILARARAPSCPRSSPIPTPTTRTVGRADAAPTLPNIARALESRGRKIGTERGYDDDPHAFKIYRVRDGRRAMEALRDALRKEEERGCLERDADGVFRVLRGRTKSIERGEGGGGGGNGV